MGWVMRCKECGVGRTMREDKRRWEAQWVGGGRVV